MITIYHNPRCGKSRDCVVHFDNLKTPYTVVKYLEHPLSVAELEELLIMLSIRPIELVRTKEKIWIENYKNKELSDQEIEKVIDIVTNPLSKKLFYCDRL